ncbi:hypothetical protein Golomagni_05972 [Golovinomyces magnicellulatus]|nr:hypothetical protein Golomagni_05972 [Golovinomyces magnicellulatus]
MGRNNENGQGAGMGSAQTSYDAHNHDTIHHDDFATPALAGLNASSDVVEITASQKMLSAMSGSLVTSLLVTPLDVVRVRLQSQKMPTAPAFTKLPMPATALAPVSAAEIGVTACCREVFFAGNNAEFCLAAPRIEGFTPSTSNTSVPHDCAVEEVQRKTYRSTMDGLRKIARNEGFTTLWRGLSPTLLMTIPANIIYFTGYDWLRFNPQSPFSKLSQDYAPLTAGSTARVVAAAAVSPIELFRTRMQAASGTSTTNHLMETFQDVKEMVKLNGYTSMWRGLSLTLWRDVPFSGLYWWGYEAIRGRLTDWRDSDRGRSHTRDNRAEARLRSQSAENHRDTFADSFTAGALSGAFASIVTMPFDVGKTRTQVFHNAPKGAGGASAVAPEQQNMLRLLLHIYHTEGVAGLWRGWIPRTLKVAPACAIMISSYEVGKTAFRGINERSQSHNTDNI